MSTRPPPSLPPPGYARRVIVDGGRTGYSMLDAGRVHGKRVLKAALTQTR
ncbi:hypothetical protein [Methylibium petroleiphilum]